MKSTSMMGISKISAALVLLFMITGLTLVSFSVSSDEPVGMSAYADITGDDPPANVTEELDLVLETVSHVISEEEEFMFEDLEVLNPEDDIPIIIEFEGEPMLPFKQRMSKEIDEEEVVAIMGLSIEETKEKIKHEKISNHEKKIKQTQDAFLSILEEDSEYDIEVKREYRDLMNGMALTIKRKDFDKIKDLPNVENVWEDKNLTLHLQDSVPLINADDVWAEQNASGDNITGEGIIVAIIDTGVAYNHSDLGNCTQAEFLAGTCARVTYGWDFYNNDNDPYDDNGHGTHVAGIIGGAGSITGVAPNVTFIVYKVCSEHGSCPSSDIIEAIQNATLYGADVISLSLGGSGYADNVYTTVIDSAVANETVVVISAGNSGPDYYSIGSPGATPSALTVGSSTKTDAISLFSSRGITFYSNGSVAGIKPDVVAPGSNINSTVPTGSCDHCTSSGYKSLSGTSMSCPHISGVVALMKQAHPDWTVEQIKSAISNQAIDIGLDSNTQGGGRVDALRSYNTSSVIIDNSVLFGLDNELNDTVWTASKILNITNIVDRTIEYNFTGGINQTGINVTINITNISLVGNASQLFNVSIIINNSLVTENGLYSGNITILSSEGQETRIPLSVLIIINPANCPEDDIYINEDTVLNTTICTIPDFNLYGVLIINASNLTLDCNNSQFIGMDVWSSRGVYMFNKHNITIKNCHFKDYQGGIYNYNGEDINIFNSNFTSNLYGIYTVVGTPKNTNVNITNNTITTDTRGRGVFFGSSSNNTIINNTIKIDYASDAIYLSSSDNNKVENNNMEAIYQGLTFGLFIVNSNNNIISNNTIGVIRYGIDLYTSSDNLIQDNNFTGFNGSTNDICILMRYSSNNNLFLRNEMGEMCSGGYEGIYSSINNTIKDTAIDVYGRSYAVQTSDTCSFILTNISSVSASYNEDHDFSIEDTSNLTRKWYLTVNITDESSNVLQDANVSVYENSTGSWILDWSQLTDSEGLVLNKPSIQYLENFTDRVYYNLNISATKESYTSNSTTIYNLSTNTQINIILDSGEADATPPTVTLVSPSDQLLTNLTNISFTCDTTDGTQLKNVSLYGNWTGSWHLNQTINISGLSNSTQFNITNFANGTYIWNCEAYDNGDNSAFATSNYTLTVNTSYISPIGIPNITIISPENNSYFGINNVTLNFTVVDETDTCNLTCWYNLDGDITGFITSGGGTTIIQLQEPDSKNLDDTYGDEQSPDTTHAIDHGLYMLESSTSGYRRWTMLRFNISSIPTSQQILNASFYGYIIFNALDSETEGFNVSTHHVYSNFTWTEEDLTWNNLPTSPTSYNSIPSYTIEYFGGAGEQTGWQYYNVTSIVSTEYDSNGNNVSILFRAHDYYGEPGTTDQIYFYSKEEVSSWPYLNITHTVDILRNITNGTYTAINLTSLSEGQHNISIICQDSEPQNGTSTITFTIDLTNPIMDNPNPADGDNVSGIGEETFSIDVSDNGAINTSAGRFFWRYPSGNPFTEEEIFCSATFCSYDLDMSDIPGGEDLDFYFEIKDMAGNTGNNGTSASPLTVTKEEVDITNPAITITSPINTTYATASIDLNVSINETPDWMGYELNEAINISLKKTETQFNNSLSIENLTFTEDENITRYLEIPKYSNVTSAYLNLSGRTSEDIAIELEEADTENLKDTQVRNTTADTNYGTSTILFLGNDNGDKGISYISFNTSSIPKDAVINSAYLNLTFSGIVWKPDVAVHYLYDDWKNGTGINILNETQLTWNNQPCGINFDNDTNCNLTYDDIKVDLDVASYEFNVTDSVKGYWYRDNMSFIIKDNEDIRNQYAVVFSKEYATTTTRPKLKITYATYPFNPYLEIGTPDGTHEWNYTGHFNSTVSPNKTSDLSSVINSALNSGACDCNGCFLDGENCTIPFLFHSDIAGRLEYSSIEIEYIYNTTITAQEGSNTLYVWANDTSGNMNYSKVVFFVDSIPPSFSGHDTNTTPHEDRDVVLNVTITDSGSVVDTVILEFTNEETSTTTNFTGAINLSTVWYINIDQDNYTAHDNVTWFWYAEDHIGNLNMSSQQEYIIANQNATHSTPILNTTSDLNRTTDDLICWNVSTADLDAEDSVVNIYRWWKDNVKQDALENQSTISSAVTGLGEDWICEVIPFDGYNNGTYRNSTTLSIANTDPVVDGITVIHSGTAYTNVLRGSLIQIQAQISDADGAGDLSEAYMNFTHSTSPGGIVNISYGAMTNISTITDGYLYEYNITLRTDQKTGTWDINISANDTANADDSNSSTVTVSTITITQGSLIQSPASIDNVVNFERGDSFQNSLGNSYDDIDVNLTIPCDTVEINMKDLGGNTITISQTNLTQCFIIWNIPTIAGSGTLGRNIFFNVSEINRSEENSTVGFDFTKYLNVTGNTTTISNVYIWTQLNPLASGHHLFINASDGLWTDITGSALYSFTLHDVDNDTLYDNATWTLPLLSGLQQFKITGTVGFINETKVCEILNPPVNEFRMILWGCTLEFTNNNAYSVDWLSKFRLYSDTEQIYVDGDLTDPLWDEYGMYALIEETLSSNTTSSHNINYTTEATTATYFEDRPDVFYVGEDAEIKLNISIQNHADDNITNVEKDIFLAYAEELLLCEGFVDCVDNISIAEEDFVTGTYTIEENLIEGNSINLYTIVYKVRTATEERLPFTREVVDINGSRQIFSVHRAKITSIAYTTLHNVRYEREDINYSEVHIVKNARTGVLYEFEEGSTIIDLGSLNPGQVIEEVKIYLQIGPEPAPPPVIPDWIGYVIVGGAILILAYVLIFKVDIRKRKWKGKKEEETFITTQ